MWWSVLDAAHRTAELGDEREVARQAYLGSWSRNEQLLALAARVLDAALAEGIRMLPLKGAVLAPLVWGDLAARPMVDVDLAVHPDDLDRAVALAGACGLERAYPERARFSRRHGHDVGFRDEHNLTVELHFRLGHELAGDASLDGIFARAIEVELLGKTRAVPSFDDQLWSVAVHAAMHAFGDSPLWPLDLSLLIERGADLERARDEAERRGFGVAFRAALRVAARALAQPGLAPAPDRGDRVRDQLLTAILGPEPLAHAPTRARSLLARALLTTRPRDAARELLRKVELRAVELWEATSQTPDRRSGT